MRSYAVQFNGRYRFGKVDCICLAMLALTLGFELFAVVATKARLNEATAQLVAAELLPPPTHGLQQDVSEERQWQSLLEASSRLTWPANAWLNCLDETADKLGAFRSFELNASAETASAILTIAQRGTLETRIEDLAGADQGCFVRVRQETAEANGGYSINIELRPAPTQEAMNE